MRLGRLWTPCTRHVRKGESEMLTDGPLVYVHLDEDGRYYIGETGNGLKGRGYNKEYVKGIITTYKACANKAMRQRYEQEIIESWERSGIPLSNEKRQTSVRLDGTCEQVTPKLKRGGGYSRRGRPMRVRIAG